MILTTRNVPFFEEPKYKKGTKLHQRLWIFYFHHWFRLGHSNKVIFWCLGFMWLLSCISSYCCTSHYLLEFVLRVNSNCLNVIFFPPGLTIQANMYYKMLIGWTSQKIKDTYSTHNAFDFKNGDVFIFKVLWNFKILFHMWNHIYAWNNNLQAFFPLVWDWWIKQCHNSQSSSHAIPFF